MKVEGDTITFENTLWVQYDGVSVQPKGPDISLTKKSDDAYLKVFNHFGRVLKLFIAEQGQWIDSDTGEPAKPIDLSQAGHVAAQPAPTRKSKGIPKSKSRSANAKSAKAAGGKSTAAKAAGEAGKSPADKGTAGKPAAKKKSARKPATGVRKSAAATTKSAASTVAKKKSKPRKPAGSKARGKSQEDGESAGRAK